MSIALESIFGFLRHDGDASLTNTLKYKHYKCIMIERVNKNKFVLRFWNDSNYKVPEEESLFLNKAELIEFIYKYQKS